MNRRRFLTISAAAMAPCTQAMAAVDTGRWTGQALGAQAEITLRGPSDVITPALAACETLLRDIEAEFSLFDAGSALTRLNRDGVLHSPPPRLVTLLDQAGQVHEWTNGRFDPTIQPLWRALFTAGDVEVARRAIGWDRVRCHSDAIHIRPGQALTLNGIAQGFATDLVTDLLRAHGFQTALVQVGEINALGGPWRVGLSDPIHGLVSTRTLTNTAIATSSPSAMPLSGGGHILDPLGQFAPLWSSVGVEATSATLADGLSTALVFADQDEVARIKREVDGIRRITLIDDAGNLQTM